MTENNPILARINELEQEAYRIKDEIAKLKESKAHRYDIMVLERDLETLTNNVKDLMDQIVEETKNEAINRTHQPAN